MKNTPIPTSTKNVNAHSPLSGSVRHINKLIMLAIGITLGVNAEAENQNLNYSYMYFENGYPSRLFAQKTSE